MNIHIYISRRRVMTFFIALMTLVVTMSVIITFYQALTPNPTIFVQSLFKILEVDREASVPAWYSSSSMLMVALLLLVIAQYKGKQHDTYTPHWRFLTFLFVCLSLDEAAQLHETFLSPLGVLIEGGSDGGTPFPWLIPALIFVAVFGLLFIKFLLHLPYRTRLLFIAAGIIYVLGAAGFEFLTGYFQPLFAQFGALGRALSHIEEFMEMVGILILLYTLINYVEANIPLLEVTFGKETDRVKSTGETQTRTSPTPQ